MAITLGIYSHLTVFTVAELAANDLVVLPTGAEPHGDVVTVGTSDRSSDAPGDLGALVAAVRSTNHREEENPHHRHEEHPA